jgi:hypothetical protein
MLQFSGAKRLRRLSPTSHECVLDVNAQLALGFNHHEFHTN